MPKEYRFPSQQEVPIMTTDWEATKPKFGPAFKGTDKHDLAQSTKFLALDEAKFTSDTTS